MIRAALVVCALLPACGPTRSTTAPAAAEQTITLGSRPFRDGEIRMRKSVFRSAFGEPGRPPLVREDSQVIREQADGERLRVTWVDRRLVDIVDGVKTTQPPSELVGRTFLIEVRSGKTVVYDADGNPCDDAPCKKAASDYTVMKSSAKSGGGGGKGLHRPIRVGEQVDDLAPILVGAQSAEFTIETARARLEKVDGNVAIFVASAKVVGQDGVTMTIDATSHYEINTGRLVLSTAKGTLRGSYPGPNGKMVTLEGPFAAEETITYR
jgi:hypothetical protein